MKFFLLKNVKMPTIVGILTFMSRKNNIIGLSEPEKNLNFLIFLYLWAFKISYFAELSLETFFITSEPGFKTNLKSLKTIQTNVQNPSSYIHECIVS